MVKLREDSVGPGIGFPGAGVIFKEGLTVRGLTTAASIWITSVIGILVGIGFWFAAIIGAEPDRASAVSLRRKQAAYRVLRLSRASLRTLEGDGSGRRPQNDQRPWIFRGQFLVTA